MTKYDVHPTGKHAAAARQTGVFSWHPDECTCRKCRRARKARARRAKPRYGQQQDKGEAAL